MREDAVCLAALALVFVVLVTNVINKNNIPLMVHYFTTHLSGKRGGGKAMCLYGHGAAAEENFNHRYVYECI